MALKRSRSVANPRVGVEEYLESLRAWRHDLQIKHFGEFLGPSLSRNYRGVRPASVVQCNGLFHRWLDLGLTNCCVLPAKLETAVLQNVSDHSSDPRYAQSLAHMVATHLKESFGMLRLVKVEDHRAREQGSGRSYPKTATFRRRCSPAEWAVLNSLLERVDISDVCASMAPMVETSDGDNIEFDEDGYPTVFGARLSKSTDCASMAACESDDDGPSTPARVSDDDRNSPRANVSLRDSEVYDKDGFPLSNCSRAATVASETPLGEAEACELATVVPPKPRVRKHMAIVRRRPAAMAAACPTACAAACADEPLEQIRIVGPTNEKNPRCEVTARGARSKRRVHVFTLTRNSWGESAYADAERVSKQIVARGLSKNEAIALKNSLKQS